MAHISGSLASVKRNEKGEYLISIRTDSVIKEDILSIRGKKVDVNISPYKESRSLVANNYMWELCEEIALSIGSSKEDVYREALRNRGVYKDVTVSEKDVASEIKEWRTFGTGWICERVDFGSEPNSVLLRKYYGTSTYNTSQMAKIIDYLSEEATDLGITVLSDKERKKVAKRNLHEGDERNCE